MAITEKSPGSSAATTELRCEMKANCTEPVTHIDSDGFVYCTAHGVQRRAWQPCRKLRPHEVNRLKAGGILARY